MKKILYLLPLILALAACKKQPFLDVDKTTLIVDVAGATETVTVSANNSWTASASDSWIKVKYTEGESALTITVSRNNDTDARQGSVTLSSQELTRTISISQAQRDAIELDSAGRLTVDAEAQQIEIKLRSNVDMNVTVTEGSDWVSIVSTKAMTARTVTLSLKANTARTMRRALVSFSDKSGAVNQQIMIDQDGKPQVLKVTFAEVPEFRVPLIMPMQGVTLSGYVYWSGDQEPVAYDKSMTRTFDPAGSGSLRLEMHNAETVSFADVVGITGIDFSEF